MLLEYRVELIMSITSFLFIIFCIFGAGILYLLPHKFQWLWLLVLNMVFYLSMGIGHIVFIIITSIVSWLGCCYITELHNRQESYLKEHKVDLNRDARKEVKRAYEIKRKRILAILICAILGQLIVLKYNGFFLQNVNVLFHRDYSTLDIIRPLGISFYTIFCLGYCVDVYRGQYKGERNLLKHITVISYFPCITQGPIERYDHLFGQIFKKHIFDWERIVFGGELVLWGLFKKLVIADHIAVATNTIFGDSQGMYQGLYIVIAALLYAIQVYADFSGYTDIVRGMSQMFGISLLENFDTPYFSKSVAEYWRRWHISMGKWYKDYVFYSVLRSAWCQKLGKKAGKYVSRSSVGKITTSVGLLINWTLIGIWHGAAWKYVAHGLYYCMFMVLGVWMKSTYDTIRLKFKINQKNFIFQCFQMLRTFCIVLFGYILFCASSFWDFIRLVKDMIFHINTEILWNGGIFSFGIDKVTALLLFLSTCVLFAVEVLHYRGMELRKTIAKKNIVIRWGLLYAIIFSILIFGAFGAEYTTEGFIYQFF